MTDDRRAAIHALAVRLHDGDRSAFAPLAEALWPVVRAFAHSARSPGVDPEDVAQEVFLRLCTRMAEFDPRRDAVAWVYGIVRYEVLTHRRRIWRRREGAAPQLAALSDPRQLEEDLVHQDLVARLGALVGELTEADRRALGLDGGPAGDATQRKRKQHALERLRALWRGRHG